MLKVFGRLNLKVDSDFKSLAQVLEINLSKDVPQQSRCTKEI